MAQTMIRLGCTNCGIKYDRKLANHNQNCNRQNTNTPETFCSQACATQYRFKGRPGKPSSNRVAELKTTTKKAQCIACDRTIAIGMYAHQSKATCDDCAADRCETCGDPTGTMRRIGVHRARFCEPCRAIWREEYDMKHAKENGRKGGLISTANSSKRSKNEMHFAELCEETFDNVSTNDACFTDKNGNNWDADVVLHDHLVAVMWNGVFHYKQIHKSQSLKQVKARDKIKKSVIKDNGYLVYVIKDMGKEDPAFVLAQFAIFLDHINSL